MGASNSKVEEDKALKLCRERKKFVRQALDGRCSLAAAHVSYVQSLKSTGIALMKFVEPGAPVESSSYTSTLATNPQAFALTERLPSHFSYSSPSNSQRFHGEDTFSPYASPHLPSNSKFQVNHMKFKGFASKKVEEKPPVPVIGKVTSSTSTPLTNTPRANETPGSSPFNASPARPEAPWDYFGLSHPIDDQLSFQEQKGESQGFEHDDDDDYTRRFREDEEFAELEDEVDKASLHESESSQDWDNEFGEHEPSLVQSYENRNRVLDHNTSNASPNIPSARSVTSEVELLNQEKNDSPDLSPVRPRPSAGTVPSDMNRTPLKENSAGNQIAPKDFFSSMKDIEFLFIKASESGKEVPKMLEANKLHFRPLFAGKESGSSASIFLKACFSCGDDPSHVQEEEPAQTSMKYLTWHRTESSRSSSSRNPLGVNLDDVEELNNNLFDDIGMITGSHASTLDRLYAWERKLYEEVKASEMVRREYDSKCRSLRELESKGESSYKIDKTRALVKDLHSRIRVAIQRIDSISKRIEELRDKELQPQLEELIEGLSRMGEVMLECHKRQFDIISVAYRGNIKISIQSDSHRQLTLHLENELSYLSSGFTKWISAQVLYLGAINDWLFKCVSLPQKSSRRKRRAPAPSLRNYGPPIYVTCGVWLEKLKALPDKEVSDSIKSLAADISRFIPRQEKNHGKGDNIGDNLLHTEVSEDFIPGYDRLLSSLDGFLGQLNKFSEASVNMYVELKKAIQDAKKVYGQL